MIWLLVSLGLMVTPAASASTTPASDVQAYDTPSDAGGSVTVRWARTTDAGTYRVMVAESPSGSFRMGAEVLAHRGIGDIDPASFGFGVADDRYHLAAVSSYASAEDPLKRVPLEKDRSYYFRVDLVSRQDVITGEAVVEAQSVGNLFNYDKLNNFILGLFICGVILLYIGLARRRDLHIRRIAGLEALDEALGRATEMGKPVMFVHGLKSMDQIPTIAAVNILGMVARRTARFGTDLRVANYDPVVMAVSQEVVKEGYLEAGRPDAYNADNIFVAGTDQFSYAAAVEGMMVRERPAAHIMMGYFYAESLLLTETGSTTGAIQIAGTDAYTQLPFFVTTCDYTLMGEELYAASAYLSREPKLLGSLKGQDVGKAVLIAVLLLGSLLSSLGVPFLTRVFAAL